MPKTLRACFAIPVTLLLFATISAIPHSVMAQSADSCSRVLLTNDLSRKLKPDYVSRFLTEANTNKVIEVPFQTPIMNQGSRGFCFMYSWFEQTVRNYKARNNGEDPELSIYYLAYHHWLGKAIETAQKPSDPLSIPEGGRFIVVIDLVRKHGLMSQAQWTKIGGRSDVELQDKNIIELGQLRALIANAHIEKDLVLKLLTPTKDKKQTYGDYYKNISTNVQASIHLQKLIVKKEKTLTTGRTNVTAQQIALLKAFQKGQYTISKLTPEEIQSVIFNLNQDIANEIREEFNHIFFGMAFNPMENLDPHEQQSLAQKIVPELNSKTINLVADGSRRSRLGFLERNDDHYALSASYEQILKTIKDRIDAGMPTYIGYNHEPYFVDDLTGAMTVEGIASEPFAPYISRGTRDLAKVTPSMHGTQIVGYEVDTTGNVIALKMQNSWGRKKGKLGYYRMDLSYFRAFVSRISFQDDTNAFSLEMLKELQEIKWLEKEKKKLSPYKI